MREGAKKKVFKLIDPMITMLGTKLKELQDQQRNSGNQGGVFFDGVEAPEAQHGDPEIQNRINQHNALTQRINNWEAAVRKSMLSVLPELEMEFIRNVSKAVEDYKVEIENI